MTGQRLLEMIHRHMRIHSPLVPSDYKQVSISELVPVVVVYCPCKTKVFANFEDWHKNTPRAGTIQKVQLRPQLYRGSGGGDVILYFGQCSECATIYWGLFMPEAVNYRESVPVP